MSDVFEDIMPTAQKRNISALSNGKIALTVCFTFRAISERVAIVYLEPLI